MTTVQDRSTKTSPAPQASPVPAPVPTAGLPSTDIETIAALPLDAKLTKEQRRSIVQAWYDADKVVREAERVRCAAAKLIAERVSSKEFKVSWTGDVLTVRVGRKTPSEDDDRHKYLVVKVEDEKIDSV
jgi:hypothetical protein